MMQKKFVLLLILQVALLPLRAQNDKPAADSIVRMEVNYKLDSDRLRTQEKKRVDSLLQIVPPKVLKQIKIYGHTDSLAGNEYNQDLSKRRVQSLLTYLMYLGVDPLNVSTEYFGEENPKYPNSPKKRYKNRRVELLLNIDPSLLPPPERKLVDNSFKKGEKIRIPNLNFVGNQPIPVSESFPVLKELLVVMRTYPDLEIELHGHVCCGDAYQLSRERAHMVYQYLVANGVDASRMTYEGYSNSDPLFKEVDERTKALNRRVEVLVKQNSGKKVKPKNKEAKVEVRAPVLSVKFFPHKGKLYPSAEFMLSLIAKMLRKSEGLYYEFLVYNNIGDSRLTGKRVVGLKRKMMDLNVKSSRFNVRKMQPPKRMPTEENENLILLKISQQK